LVEDIDGKLFEQRMASITLFPGDMWLQNRDGGTHEFQGAYVFTQENVLYGAYWGNIFDPNHALIWREFELLDLIDEPLL
jgi:predicted N-acyltransferase